MGQSIIDRDAKFNRNKCSSLETHEETHNQKDSARSKVTNNLKKKFHAVKNLFSKILTHKNINEKYFRETRDLNKSIPKFSKNQRLFNISRKSSQSNHKQIKNSS